MNHEANIHETLNPTFEIDRSGEKWTITDIWLMADRKEICWYDGFCTRNGVRFFRIFSPAEIVALAPDRLKII